MTNTSYDNYVEENTTLGKLDSKKDQYVDIDLKLSLNPVTRDIVKKKDVSAINQSLRNLMLTNFFDRPFDPSFGGNMYKTLFEPADEISLINMSKDIQDIITNKEKRIIVLDVNVELDVKDENTLIITIVYTLPAFEGQISTAFSIERVR